MSAKEREQAIPVEKLLAGLLAVVVADRDDRLTEGEPRRSELILAEAGFSIGEISALTGRKYETVKSALRRSKPTPAKPRSVAPESEA